MNAIKNKVQLIGNLGNIPEITETENGIKKANLVVSTMETIRSHSGEKLRETIWHNVTCYGKLAEICEKYLTKGTEIAVEGKLVNSHYTDKMGIKRYVTEVCANELLILTKQS